MKGLITLLLLCSVQLGALAAQNNCCGQAFLGVYSEGVSAEKAKKLGFENRYGSYVSSIIGNTAAEKFGFQPFDYIFGVNEYRTGPGTDLSDILSEYKPGDEVVIHFVRSGQKQSQKVTLGDREDAKPAKENAAEKAFLGVSPVEMGRDQMEGVKVNVVDGSSADKIGIRDGDRLLKINNITLFDWTDVSIAIKTLKAGEIVKIQYLRQGEKGEVSGPMGAYADSHKDEEYYNEGSNYNFNWNFNRSDEEEEAEGDNENRPEINYTPVDLSNVQVQTGTLTEEEAGQMLPLLGLDGATANDVKLDGLTVVPNPQAKRFKLSFRLIDAGETSIEVYNRAGRLIYSNDPGNLQGEFSDDVDMGQNGAGDYFLRVRQGERQTLRKISLFNS